MACHDWWAKFFHRLILTVQTIVFAYAVIQIYLLVLVGIFSPGVPRPPPLVF
ncbi:hypothetical protein BDC45DRAFT_514200 [Circinella umbellata]|nr:hypothetical protein BDC45DRAFT_514200 [Circinella umbellata]